MKSAFDLQRLNSFGAKPERIGPKHSGKPTLFRLAECASKAFALSFNLAGLPCPAALPRERFSLPA